MTNMPTKAPRIGEYARYPKTIKIIEPEIINDDEYNPDFYYLLTIEWLYPSDPGRDVHCDVFDTKAEALEKAREYCRIETIYVKRDGDSNLKNLDFTWGPYADFGFTREDNPDKIGYMIVWDSSPRYYFKTRIIKMKLDKEIPIGKGMYSRDDNVTSVRIDNEAEDARTKPCG